MTNIFSGKGAFINFGVMLGTIMAASVCVLLSFLVKSKC
ncbi:hypothetical protein H4J38_11035 [Colwellia sp. BRX10-3]|nr:hypothetical protein [Colwellia sp. BRX10-3]